MPDPNQTIVEEFRANGGAVGGPFAGARLLLLTTTGARTGLPRTSPMAYFPDGDRTLVAASNAGAPTHPLWHRNLMVDPRVTVEIGHERSTAVAVVLEGEERDRCRRSTGCAASTSRSPNGWLRRGPCWPDHATGCRSVTNSSG